MSIRCSNISRKRKRLVSCLGANKDVHDLFVFQYDECHQMSCEVLNILPGKCYRLHALWTVKERCTGFACPLPTRRE